MQLYLFFLPFMLSSSFCAGKVGSSMRKARFQVDVLKLVEAESAKWQKEIQQLKSEIDAMKEKGRENGKKQGKKRNKEEHSESKQFRTKRKYDIWTERARALTVIVFGSIAFLHGKSRTNTHLDVNKHPNTAIFISDDSTNDVATASFCPSAGTATTTTTTADESVPLHFVSPQQCNNNHSIACNKSQGKEDEDISSSTLVLKPSQRPWMRMDSQNPRLAGAADSGLSQGELEEEDDDDTYDDHNKEADSFALVRSLEMTTTLGVVGIHQQHTQQTTPAAAKSGTDPFLASCNNSNLYCQFNGSHSNNKNTGDSNTDLVSSILDEMDAMIAETSLRWRTLLEQDLENNTTRKHQSLQLGIDSTSYSNDSPNNDHLRIIEQQQAEIEALKALLFGRHYNKYNTDMTSNNHNIAAEETDDIPVRHIEVIHILEETMSGMHDPDDLTV